MQFRWDGGNDDSNNDDDAFILLIKCITRRLIPGN